MAGQKPTRVNSLTLATMAGQAGCAALVLILIALAIGLWLDARFGVRGLFTIGLLLISIPISLFAMVRIALGTINKIQTGPRRDLRVNTSHTEEE